MPSHDRSNSSRRTGKKWRLYEELVALYHARHPNARVTRNKTITLSDGTKRFVDVWIEQEVPYLPRPIRIAINCKDYKRRLSREDIGGAWEQFEDVRADVNMIITSSGFDGGATKAADKRRIERLILAWDEAIRTAWEAPFFDACRILEAVRRDGRPTPEDAERVVEYIEKPSLAHFFFHDLQNAGWLKVLHACGYLRRALHDQASWLSVDVTHYVQGAGHVAPDVVLDLIDAVPDPNYHCARNLLAAAVALQEPEHQAMAARAISRWPVIRQLACDDLASALIGSLCRADRGEAAVLFGACWGPSRTGRSHSSDGTDGRDWASAAQLHRLSQERLTALLERFPLEVWGALEAHLHSTADGGGGIRLLTRQAIEPHPQDRQFGRLVEFADVLIDACRDALVAVCRSDKAAGEDILRRLVRDRDPLRRRLGIHAVRVCAPDFVPLVRKVLGSATLREDATAHHEFWLLAGDCLSVLTETQRADFLGWILASPEWARDMPREYRELKTRDYLQMINSQLRDDEARVLHRLLRKYGRAPHPEFRTYSSGIMTGPNSPLTAEQMAAFSAAELFRWLAAFEPSPREIGMECIPPSPEGAARVMHADVLRRPHEFAEALGGMPDLRFPTYYAHLFRAFAKAARDLRAHAIDPQIRLAHAVTGRQDAPDVGTLDTFDVGEWRYVRQEVCDWVEAVANADTLTGSQMDAVWSLLERLHERTAFSDCSVSGVGAVTESLNTLSGRLTHAICAFAVSGARRKEQGDPAADARIGDGSRADARAFALLTSLLSPADAAVRAALGMWLGALHFAWPDWVEQHAPDLFPQEDDLWRPTWEGYLFGTRSISREVYALLRREYLRSVACLSADAEGGEREECRCLASHLAAVYLSGVEDPEDPGSVLHRLVETRNDDCLAHIAWCLGSLLRDDGKEGVRDWPALRRWWDLRAGDLRRRPLEEGRREAEAFTMWLGDLPSAESLDTVWPSLEPCLARLSDRSLIDCDIEYLATQAERCPARAVKVLDDILRQRRLCFPTRVDAVRAVLVAAQKADGESRRLAVDLAHWLGENLGLYGLREVAEPGEENA